MSDAIPVEFSGNEYMMIGVSGTNGVLVDPAGVITLGALTSIIVIDVNITEKVRYLRSL